MTLKNELQIVKQHYFPRWDRLSQWKILSDSKLGEVGIGGRCEFNNKTVCIWPELVEKGGDELSSIIIHEVCHAVCGSGHGARWVDRMEKAANRALQLGVNELSKLIIQDIERHAGPQSSQAVPLTHRHLLLLMDEILTQNPKVSFEWVLKHLATNHFVRTIEELKAAGAKKAFEESKQIIRNREKTRLTARKRRDSKTRDTNN